MGCVYASALHFCKSKVVVGTSVIESVDNLAISATNGLKGLGKFKLLAWQR